MDKSNYDFEALFQRLADPRAPRPLITVETYIHGVERKEVFRSRPGMPDFLVAILDGIRVATHENPDEITIRIFRPLREGPP